MTRETPVSAGVDAHGATHVRKRGRRRLVPPAVTPVRAADIGAAVADHARGRGKDVFCRTIADQLEADSAGTYTSFRRALGACLRGLAATDPDRSTVLVPAFCSSDYPDAVQGVGLEMERYRIDRETLSLSLDALERRLADADDVLALVVVNVLGYGSPMSAVADLCSDREVALVETLGYALGTTYRGQPLGTFGDCAVLNFQEGKPIPVGGGMVVSRDPAVPVSDTGRPPARPNVGALAGYAAVARPRLFYGYDAAADWLDSHDVLTDRVTTHPGSKRNVGYEGPLATMSDFQGALGHRLLDRLPAHRRQRAQNARFYADVLAGLDGLSLLGAVDGVERHQHVRFPVVADDPDLRSAILDELQHHGIQAASMYGWPEIDGEAYPDARLLQRRLFTLPTHPYVTPADRETAVQAIRRVLADR